MSEDEKFLQVGRLAEEYSSLRGQLNHLQEKFARAQADYLMVGQNFSAFRAINGKLVGPHGLRTQAGVLVDSFSGLLSSTELIHSLEEKERLATEVASCANRLRALAPHLV